MIQLEPMLEASQLRDVRIFDGRFPIQLELPSNSTLTDQDIERVATLASWYTDPNKSAEGYEGGRSILISRQTPVIKKGMILAALQLSGIGYMPIETEGIVGISYDKGLCPPSNENFMANIPQDSGKMVTSHFSNGQYNHLRPSYRALGCYTQEELVTKLNNTRKASDFKLERLVIPGVEAYGRYLSSDLGNSQGQFGFLVTQTPAVDKKRTMGEITDSLFEETKTMNQGEALYKFWMLFTGASSELEAGLRELHDKARHAHLQVHASNYYIVNGKVCLVDWGTMHRLGEDREGNIGNRVIDLIKPSSNYRTMTEFLFKGLPARIIDQSAHEFLTTLCEAYTSLDESRILNTIGSIALKQGDNSTDADILCQMLKDFGYEGFPIRNHQQTQSRKPSYKKIRSNQKTRTTTSFPVKKEPNPGRNEKCWCGSGKKFKKCCGRNK